MKKRIWELDTLRGFAFILMAFDHLTYDLARVFQTMWFGYQPSDHFLYKITQLALLYRNSSLSTIIRFGLISGVFLFISGIVSNLSRNNIKRGFRLFIIAVSLSIITYTAQYFTGYGVGIFFGILHCLAVSMMMAPLLMKLNNYKLASLGIIIIFLGIIFGRIEIPQSWTILNFLNDKLNLLAIINIRSDAFSSSDYYPIFPFLGIFLLGIVFGRIFYKEKQSVFKKEYQPGVLNYFGRNAMWLYFAHQILLFVIIYIIGLIFV